MSNDEYRPKLVQQPRRLPPEERPLPPVGPARRYLNDEDTAALLEVSVATLQRWRAMGYGVQPTLRPEGRLYRAEEIERLAAIPKARRMLVITSYR